MTELEIILSEKRDELSQKIGRLEVLISEQHRCIEGGFMPSVDVRRKCRSIAKDVDATFARISE